MGGASNRWLSVRENSSQKHRAVCGQQPKSTATPVDNDHFIDKDMRALSIAAGLLFAIVALLQFFLAIGCVAAGTSQRLVLWGRHL